MTTADLIKCRLINQQIAETNFKTPREIVGWLGAMQAQEYAMAKWAIGLRLPHLVDADVEKAFTQGQILRTHLLRPTWHFVTPEDIRWILAFTAPRVNAFNASMYRKMELDSKVFKRSNNTLIKALRDGKQLTRIELKTSLANAKITADGIRLACIFMHAELDGIICSGARSGKQFTYALLDERVPPTKPLRKEEALAKLTLTYFRSRGPATLQDYVWWSGLTMKEVKEGVELVKHLLREEFIKGKQFLLTNTTMDIASTATLKKKAQSTFLMPDYDEYGISYKDRSAIFKTEHKSHLPQSPRSDLVFNHVIVVNGVVAGMWKRVEKNKNILVETTPFTEVNKAQQSALSKAIKRYVSFARSI